ncbi:MAG: hypothetical protein WBD55_07035 [Dehalococcoidia bacterium]
MNWLGLGLSSHILARIAEFQMLPMLRNHRREPDRELPDVELPDAERQAAIDRELTRRLPEARA